MKEIVEAKLPMYRTPPKQTRSPGSLGGVSYSLIFCKDYRRTGIRPYEILLGSAPTTGSYVPQRMSALHSDLTSYVSALQDRLTARFRSS